MLIESGPNAERKVRSFLLFLLVAIFAFWYGYDGWVGYPKKNLNEFLKTLPAEQRQQAGDIKINPSVNEETIPRLEKLQINVADRPEDDIAKVLGGPPSLKTPDAWYYIGPGYWVRFGARNDRPTGELKFDRLPHTATDVRWQKNYGYGLSVLALAALIYVIRVRMAKARLDDAGLTLGSGPTIAWDAMKQLDSSRFRAKGWVDLVHGDPEESTRIDEYHYAKFDEIIEEICARKGFLNPLIKVPADDSDDDEAETADKADLLPDDQPKG